MQRTNNMYEIEAYEYNYSIDVKIMNILLHRMTNISGQNNYYTSKSQKDRIHLAQLSTINYND